MKNPSLPLSVHPVNRSSRRRWGAAAAAGAVLASLLTVAGVPSVGTPPAGAVVVDRARTVIVRLVPGTSITTMLSAYGLTLVDTMTGLPGTYLVIANDGRTADALAATLAVDARVTLADANNVDLRTPEVAFSGRIYRWTSSTPTQAQTQPVLTKLDLATAHTISKGAGVKVAVIDTGVTPMASFGGTVLPGLDLVDGDANAGDSANRVDDNGNGVVDEAAGHGTYVAGIVHLVAPAASILPIRVLNDDGVGETWNVAKAMLWAADRGATVVNLSLGQNGSSGLLKQAVGELKRRNVVAVAAAGNEGRKRESFPAAAKCALGVTSTTPTDGVSTFASYGPWISAAAPGEGVVSAFPYTSTGLARWSGTSASAPFVTGQVALLRSLRPTLTVLKARAMITSTSVPVTAPPANFGTAGRINIVASLRAPVPSEPRC